MLMHDLFVVANFLVYVLLFWRSWLAAMAHWLSANASTTAVDWLEKLLSGM